MENIKTIKICIAINVPGAETELKNKLPVYIGEKLGYNVMFTDSAVYKDQVLTILTREKPDVLILKERLSNEKNGIDIDTLLSTIRIQHNYCRVILIAGNYPPGHPFLSRQISKGIYDILHGKNCSIDEIMRLVTDPRQYKDVAYLLGNDNDIGNDLLDDVDIIPGGKGTKGKQRLIGTSRDTTPSVKPKAVSTMEQPSYQKKPYGIPPSQGGSSNLYKEPKRKSTAYVPPVQEVEPTSFVKPDEFISDTEILTSSMLTHDVSEISPKLSNGGVEFITISTQFAAQERKKEEVKATPSESGTPQVSNIDYNSSSVLYTNMKTNTAETDNGIQQTYDQYGHNIKNVLYGENKPLATYQKTTPPKVITFTGARQGAGTSTLAINIAAAIATTGKRVLYIDTSFGPSSVFDRLGMPKRNYNFDEVINSDNMHIESLCLSRKEEEVYKSVSINHAKAVLPETLRLLKMSQNFNPSAHTFNMAAALYRLTYFDYVICDTDFAAMDEFTTAIISGSTKVFICTAQDSYDLNILYNYMAYYNDKFPLKQVSSVIMNRGMDGVFPERKNVSDYLGIGSVYIVPDDTKGFLRCSAAGDIYYTTHSWRAKRALNAIVSDLLGGAISGFKFGK